MAPLLFTLMLSLGSSGPQQNDLRITIARIETPDAKPNNPELAITLENRGSEDFVVVLFRSTPFNSFAPFDVSSDGTKFVINTLSSGPTPPLTLIGNWTATLQRQ